MFGRKPKAENPKLEEAMDKCLDEMVEYGPDTEEFKSALNMMERLNKMRPRRRFNVSADTMVIAGANILGILIIVGYERAHVVTTKALGFKLPTK